MDKKKRYSLIFLYVIVLFAIGFFLIIVTSKSKLNNQIDIFSNTENDTETRWNALSKIAHYNENVVTETILKALDDRDPYIRMEAAKWAERRREFRAIPVLIRNLKDNTKILHPKAGKRLELVKITSYKALMKITGRDFGPIESSPLEVAETIRKWELWWYKNAHIFGVEVDEIKPDYETAILSYRTGIQRRIALLNDAEKEMYPGLEDITVELLQNEPYSLLKQRAFALAGAYRFKNAIPVLLTHLKDRTLHEALLGTRLPLVAVWANEALVQITGHNLGPVYNGMSEKEQNELAGQWDEFIASYRKQSSETVR